MSVDRYPVLGRVIYAERVIVAGFDPRKSQRIILLLTACVALMMTGVGIIMPVFARRLGEFGEGVEALGLMTMSFALAQLIASPFMGTLADRIGRRPLVLIALLAFAATNIGYLLTDSAASFITVRALGGIFTAGLFPAAMSIVADIVPREARAQWIGFVMAGYGVGFIFGPALGGFLYDEWGFSAPFLISAGSAVLALVAAFILVPETRPKSVRGRGESGQCLDAEPQPESSRSFWVSLPKPVYVFLLLLFLDFIGSFAFAFVEPQMIFFFYDELGWSTTSFGVIVGVYGLAMVIGQMFLGRASDRFGRKPVIVLGLLLTSTLYAGMAFSTSYAIIVIICIISGLGSALTAPALSAFYLDITPEQHRSRILGIKESALALGGVMGPLLVAIVTGFMNSQGIFIFAGLLIVGSAFSGAIVFREPVQPPLETKDTKWEISHRRAISAQASMRGVVLRARKTRAQRQPPG
jgi:multidrug resistance protein